MADNYFSTPYHFEPETAGSLEVHQTSVPLDNWEPSAALRAATYEGIGNLPLAVREQVITDEEEQQVYRVTPVNYEEIIVSGQPQILRPTKYSSGHGNIEPIPNTSSFPESANEHTPNGVPDVPIQAGQGTSSSLNSIATPVPTSLETDSEHWTVKYRHLFPESEQKDTNKIGGPAPHVQRAAANRPAIHTATPPIRYGPYASLFKDAAEAKAHRNSVHAPPKPKDARFEEVKTHGRRVWVLRIYEALINDVEVQDSPNSVPYQRFISKPAFDQAGLEATAHKVFDSTIRVYEKGWTRPSAFYKIPLRGPKKDTTTSLEERLQAVCDVLAISKALCGDAVGGGIPLRRLVDNPRAQLTNKEHNKAGNIRKGKYMQKGREASAKTECRKRKAHEGDEGDEQAEAGRKRARRG